MFDITCATCDQRYLVGSRSIVALRNTGQGPVAVVRCPAGHLLEHEFRKPARRAAALSGEQRHQERPGIRVSRASPSR